MAGREANVKLTLDAGGFVSTFASHMSQVEARARQTEGSLKGSFGRAMKSLGAGTGEAFKSGFGGAKAGIKGAMGDIGSTVKQGFGVVAGLGGGIGMGMMIENAIDLREKVRNIEFQINKTGQATASWEDVMADVHSAAQETGYSSEEMADAFHSSFEGAGDADYASAAIRAAGNTARATGKDLGQLVDVTTMLYEKFGATPDTLPDMLAAVAEKTDTGGLALDSMREKFGLLAGEAVDAGFKGSAGISAVVGMLNALDDRLGEKSIPSFKKLFQTLKDGSSSLKDITKLSGGAVHFKEGETGLEKLHKIVGSDKARAALTQKLGGEQRVVFDELLKPFKAAFDEAKAHGATAKQATAKGLAAFDAAMSKMSEHTMTAASVQKRATEQQKDDPRIALKKAIDKVGQEFQKPEMIDAIDTLSEKLPQLAQGTSSAIDWIVKHPKEAVAGAVGAKIAVGGITGFAEKFTEKALSSAFSTAGDAFVKKVVTDGGWGKLAGNFGMVAAGAFAAYEGGKSLIDDSLGADDKKRAALADLQGDAEAMAKHGTGTAEQRELVAEQLRARIAQMEKEGGPGIATRLFGGIANLVDPAHLNAQGQVEGTEHPVNEWNKQLADAKAALEELEKSGTGTKNAQQKLADASMRAAAALERMSSAADAGGPDPGMPTGKSKGVGGPANRHNVPGHAL